MITDNTKKIFNNAAKANEKFVREAISVFPKIELNTDIKNISKNNIKKFTNKSNKKILGMI
jgi:hypothetical protein|tara:strand:+ start:743 stop:925 length:183 start_codon:yes stop_codon:yes gene_type:complete